jgi:proline racemase
MCLKINAISTVMGKTKPIKSVVTKLRQNSVFADAVCRDVSSGIGAFASARLEVINAGKKANANNGVIKKIFSWIGFQSKGAIKGSCAVAKKTGLVPVITAATGFASCIPGGTTVGLFFGIVAKNLFKILKNLVIK